MPPRTAAGQPWKPSDATDTFREVAADAGLNLVLTKHAREQMRERDLLMGDVLYVLKHGFVFSDAAESTQPGYYKYVMQSGTPSSGSRSVGVVAIPDVPGRTIKVVTVMWVDG